MRFIHNGSCLYETPVREPSHITHDEAIELLLDLIDHLELDALRTNATESGTDEIVIRPR